MQAVWRLEFSREAAKSFLRMPRSEALRVRGKLDELARDPMNAPNVKKLTEHPGFRLRVGDWRVIYLLDHGAVVIQVIRIAQRGEVSR
jgi:mRNA interferase RelE/StbE